MRRLFPLALLAAAACIDDLEPQYRVTDLRILAVRAEVESPDASWADVVPGDTLRLEALVANPRERAPLEVRWYACVPPEGGAVPACVDEAVLRDPSALAALAADPARSGVAQIAAGPTPAPLALEALRAQLDTAVAAVVQLAREEPTWACRLYAEIPLAVVAEAEGLREVALKRVRLTPDPDGDPPLEPALAGAYLRNANPAVAGVLHAATEAGCVDGAPLETISLPSGRRFLCGITAHEPERYNVCDDVGGRTLVRESLDWQWYVTAGEFPEVGGIGNATGSAPELERAPGPFTLWAILRDGRGGVAWDRYDVGPAP